MPARLPLTVATVPDLGRRHRSRTVHAARPRLEDATRDGRCEVRCTVREREAWGRVAHDAGLSVSAWLRGLAAVAVAQRARRQ